jgi:hypothetical protein
MVEAVSNVIDLSVRRRIRLLRKNNAILQKALDVYEHDKDLFHEILKEYEYTYG